MGDGDQEWQPVLQAARSIADAAGTLLTTYHVDSRDDGLPTAIAQDLLGALTFTLISLRSLASSMSVGIAQHQDPTFVSSEAHPLGQGPGAAAGRLASNAAHALQESLDLLTRALEELTRPY